MNYLNPNGQEFYHDSTEPLFALEESEYGVNAYDHPRVEIAPVGDRLHELSLGRGALALFELSGTQAPAATRRAADLVRY